MLKRFVSSLVEMSPAGDHDIWLSRNLSWVIWRFLFLTEKSCRQPFIIKDFYFVADWHPTPWYGCQKIIFKYKMEAIYKKLMFDVIWKLVLVGWQKNLTKGMDLFLVPPATDELGVQVVIFSFKRLSLLILNLSPTHWKRHESISCLSSYRLIRRAGYNL